VTIGASILLLALRHVPESPDESVPDKVDLPGAVLVAVALAGSAYGPLVALVVGLGLAITVAPVTATALALAAAPAEHARLASPANNDVARIGGLVAGHGAQRADRAGDASTSTAPGTHRPGRWWGGSRRRRSGRGVGSQGCRWPDPLLT